MDFSICFVVCLVFFSWFAMVEEGMFCVLAF